VERKSMDYLWSVGVMEYWVRAIFLERNFTIKSVIPGNPGSSPGLRDPESRIFLSKPA